LEDQSRPINDFISILLPGQYRLLQVPNLGSLDDFEKALRNLIMMKIMQTAFRTAREKVGNNKYIGTYIK